LQSYIRIQMEILIQLEDFIVLLWVFAYAIVNEMLFAVRFATKRENHY
jgi:hypothetical protein